MVHFRSAGFGCWIHVNQHKHMWAMLHIRVILHIGTMLHRIEIKFSSILDDGLMDQFSFLK